MPILCLSFIVGSATLVSYVIVDPLLRPNLHPRLTRIERYLVRFHPRLVRYVPIAALISLQIALLSLKLQTHYSVRKRGLLSPRELKSGRYLNQSMEQTIGLLPPEAWQVVKLALPGLCISVPDLRSSHWELLEENEIKREMRLVLQYVHNPLGIKIWRLYPRRMLCTVKLKGKGVSTKVELTYSADSAMDYRTVYEIIDQTNKEISAAMAAEKAVRC
jgi:hypothetical protein